MTLGDKLSKLRKEHNYTQEQLADILGVSRQSVSKWESDIAYPEIEKLLKLGDIYNCSMDYLLKDMETDKKEDTQNPKAITFTLNLYTGSFERKSKRTVCGLPLWHINIGYGRTATGIFAIGFFAKGIVSGGIFSTGVLSFGVLSLGVIALGTFAVGLISAAAIALGVMAFGAVSIGIVSVGAASVGLFSIGASANGKYFALGDSANALIALGDTKANGSIYQKIGSHTKNDISIAKELLDKIVPPLLSWAKEIIKMFLR